MTGSEPSGRRVTLVLAALVVGFGALASRYAVQLTNGYFGDIEFSGWSNPLGHRLLAGDRPYADFFLPIPPGSFLVLAWIERLRGQYLLSSELYLNAACHLGMGLSAYYGVRGFSSRFNALCTAIASTLFVAQFNKECAYDHTAQLVAWIGSGVAVRALLATDADSRGRLWLATGVLAGLTHLFKQSTGVGLCLGWLSAIGVQIWAGGLRDRANLRARWKDARNLVLGMVLGFAATLATVLALRGSVLGFLRTVYVDGPSLKGGSAHLVEVLITYVARLDAYSTAPLVFLPIVAVAWRAVARGGAFAAAWRDEALTSRAMWGLVVAALLGCLYPWWLLGSAVSRLPPALLAFSDQFKFLPAFGLPLGIALAFGETSGVAAAERRTARAVAFAAWLLGVLIASLFHNTSAPELRAYYDNNPIIFAAFACLLVALDAADWRRGKALVLVLALGASLSTKFDRALGARIPVRAGSYWAGLTINFNAKVQTEIAELVRARTTAHDTVLVLPEDLQLVPLVDRPRPNLRGAVVFVDQYPRAMLRRDAQELIEHPPAVIVLNPAEKAPWQRLYRTWTATSPAEQLELYVLEQLLPAYQRICVVPWNFLATRTTLEVWVRRDH